MSDEVQQLHVAVAVPSGLQLASSVTVAANVQYLADKQTVTK